MSIGGINPYLATYAAASAYGTPSYAAAPQFTGYDPYATAMPQMGGYNPYASAMPQLSAYNPYAQQAPQAVGYNPYAQQAPQTAGYNPYATAAGSSYGIPAYGAPSATGPFMGSIGGMSPQNQYIGDLLNMNQGKVDPNFGLIPAASSNFLGTTLALGGAQSLPFSIGRGTSASSLPPLLTGLPVFDVKHFIDGQYQSPMMANPLMSSQMSGANPLVPYFSPQGQSNYFNQGFPAYNGYPGFQM